MKTLFICLLLSCSAPAFAQTALVTEAAQPFEDATTIVIHSKDSPETAYQNALAGILTAGYGLDKAQKDALFISTTAKPLEKGVYVKMQAVVVVTPTGSDTMLRGSFSWLSATTIMAHIENRELPLVYKGEGNNPVKRAWKELPRVAALVAPNAALTYAKGP